MRMHEVGGLAVLVLDGDGPDVGKVAIEDLLQGAFDASARTVAIEVARLGPAFFDLRSGVAGEMV